MNEVQIPVSVVARTDAEKCKDRDDQRHEQSHWYRQAGLVCVLFGKCSISAVFGHVS